MKNVFFLLMVLTMFAGCIRFYGEAGYTKPAAEAGTYETKAVSVDSSRLISGDSNPGNIEMGEV